MLATAEKPNTDATWEQELRHSVTEPRELPDFLGIDEATATKVARRYPMAVTPYYLSLIQSKGDPIYNQCIPDIREVTDSEGLDDPLDEEALSPVPGLTRRYPDRVLFLVSSRCAVYCRFCNRKRKVGTPSMVTRETIRQGLEYIRRHREIRDVLLSGGDPLLLGDGFLERILKELRQMPHVEILRIGTRVPCTLPSRVTAQLAGMLKKYQPLYIHTHFNHPREITAMSSKACEILADAGIPLGCQTVLLKGVNDDPDTMRELMHGLLRIRVRPYYLFQADLARGTSHFWAPVKKGLDIIRGLQGYTSGLCIPHFAIDLPGGGGKVPLLPEYVLESDEDSLVVKNYRGETYRYPTRPMREDCE